MAKISHVFKEMEFNKYTSGACLAMAQLYDPFIAQYRHHHHLYHLALLHRFYKLQTHFKQNRLD